MDHTSKSASFNQSRISSIRSKSLSVPTRMSRRRKSRKQLPKGESLERKRKLMKKTNQYKLVLRELPLINPLEEQGSYTEVMLKQLLPSPRNPAPKRRLPPLQRQSRKKKLNSPQEDKRLEGKINKINNPKPSSKCLK